MLELTSSTVQKKIHELKLNGDPGRGKPRPTMNCSVYCVVTLFVVGVRLASPANLHIQINSHNICFKVLNVC